METLRLARDLKERVLLSTGVLPGKVEGVIDVHYASLTFHGVQWIYLDGHPSTYQPPPTGLNFGEQSGTGVQLW